MWYVNNGDQQSKYEWWLWYVKNYEQGLYNEYVYARYVKYVTMCNLQGKIELLHTCHVS